MHLVEMSASFTEQLIKFSEKNLRLFHAKNRNFPLIIDGLQFSNVMILLIPP